MPQITAVMIDTREPPSIQQLKFNGVPTMVTFLETGDALAVTDDGHTIIVERKTPEDFLGSLKDGRILPQLSRMVQPRYEQQDKGETITYWPYLVITEPFKVDNNGKVITDRGVTGWSFSAVMGAILSIQEMGIFVVFSNNANDYQDCILRLGKRDRNEITLKPPRPANIIGPKANFLASLPGIGIERVNDLLEWSGHHPGMALSGITDMSIDAPIGWKTRMTIRAMLGLEENERIEIFSEPKETIIQQGETNA